MTRFQPWSGWCYRNIFCVYRQLNIPFLHYWQVDKKMRMAMEYLISCISQSNCQSLEIFIPDLVELVLPLVSSRIASELAQCLLLIMKNIIDCDALRHISLQIVYANLRLYRTSHDIPRDWNAEDLNVCASRLTRILYDQSKIGGKTTLSQGKRRKMGFFTLCKHSHFSTRFISTVFIGVLQFSVPFIEEDVRR